MGRLNRYPANAVRKLIWANNSQAVAKKLIGMLELVVLANNEDIVKEEASGKRLRASKPRS